MLEIDCFGDLLKRMRFGDQLAVGQFVRQFEPHIQRSVRIPIRYYRLHRILDTADISQAVLADFFQRDVLDRIATKCPKRLKRLLVRMARHKVLDEARKNQADCRDQRRLDAFCSETISEVSVERDLSPCKIVESNELVGEIYSRLSNEELMIAKLRVDGVDWITIAQERGGKPDALRKKLRRAIERVSHEIGLAPHAVS